MIDGCRGEAGVYENPKGDPPALNHERRSRALLGSAPRGSARCQLTLGRPRSGFALENITAASIVSLSR
jgi:hypothetical protein